jgi:hypothetical protein
MEGLMLSSITQKGIEAQLKAEQRANELGYVISKPTTDCCRYDMIIDDGNRLLRIQVKYCSHVQNASKGSVTVNLRKYSVNGKCREYYTEQEIDALIVYVHPVNKLCYFPSSVINGKKSLTIRYEKPLNNQKTKMLYLYDYLW